MIRQSLLLLSIALPAALLPGKSAQAHGDDDPLLYQVMINDLERVKSGDDYHLAWDAEFWLGRDLDKFWLGTRGTRAQGRVEEQVLELRYSRAVSAFWDVHLGWRRDQRPAPEADWLALGFKGFAPYRIDTDAMLYLNDEGVAQVNLVGEYEYRLTRRWVLMPEARVLLHNKDDAETGAGAGLSQLELGLRLGYELRREFTPYVRVGWTKRFGQTADYAQAAGEERQQREIAVGISAWF
jgi:copper resistance protein B